MSNQLIVFAPNVKGIIFINPSESSNDAPAVQKNKHNALFCFVIDIVHREEE